MSSWQPDSDALSQLIQVLRYADSPSTEAQQQVIQQLETFANTIPSFPAYLLYIFIFVNSESENVRLRAGLSLKNNVTQRLAAFPPEILEYVKESIWNGLEDNSPAVRNTSASVLDWLFKTIGPLQWPQALLKLQQYMGASKVATQEAAYKAIANICRQSPRVLCDLEVNGSKPMSGLLPTLIHTGLVSDSASIRASSIEAINPFIISQPPLLTQHLNAFLTNVFNLTSDPSQKVRKGVIETLNMLLQFWPDQIIPVIENVIDYMLYCLNGKDEDEDLALLAAEFLLTFTEEPELYEHLQVHLERFLPGLLQTMTYTSSSREVLDLEEEDYATPDKATDIKPHMHKSRTAGASGGGGGSSNNAKVPSLAARMGMTADDVAAAGNGFDEGAEDEDEYDEEDEEEEDADEAWTLRKASAKALSCAAESFGGALLDILLPKLQPMLSNGDDWLQREAAITALGYIAFGCIESMHDHLPSLVPFLLESLNDQHPLIRASAAETLGEYCTWIGNSDTETGGGTTFLLPTIQGLLTVALDNNKHTQSRSISSFAYIAKEAGPSGSLNPYLPDIINVFTQAFGKYQSKNIMKLYDAIAQLSDGVGEAGLNDEALLANLMPPLIERWSRFSDTDDDLRYLLECLTSLVVAAGPAFAPYAGPVLQRAYRIIHSSLYQYQLYQADQASNDAPEKAWIVVPLDLISGLTIALKESAVAELAPFVSQSEAGQSPMLLICLSYPEAGVRQSAYALVGDIAANAISSLYPVLGQLMPLISDSINPTPRMATSSMDSNIVWSLGELALALGSHIAPFVPNMLERLLPILSSVKASGLLSENTAITIGRLALAAPEQVALRLSDLLRPWSQTMLHVSKGSEQDSALRGLCEVIKINPQAVQGNENWVLEALRQCTNPSNELRNASEPIIRALQSS